MNGHPVETSPFDEMSVKDITLTRDYLFQSCKRIPKEFLESTKYSEEWDGIFQEMVLSLHAYIFGEQLERFEITYPSTGWEHFKEIVFPSWLKKMFPVKYATTVWKADALYDKVSLPELTPVIKFRRVENK